MKRFFATTLAALFLFAAWSLAVAAEKKEETKSASGKGLFINYKPPMTGKPAGRVGGATRGTGDAALRIDALVPEHVGLTSTPQPQLCWYLSKQTDIRFEITINDEKSITPVLEKSLRSQEKAGISCVKLSDYQVSLRPGIEYQWFVAIIPDPDQRSKDIFSGGSVTYIEATKEVREGLATAKGADVVRIYAEGGYWYDALQSVSDLIKADPKEESYREMRRELLRQIGLSKIADKELD